MENDILRFKKKAVMTISILTRREEVRNVTTMNATHEKSVGKLKIMYLRISDSRKMTYDECKASNE